MRSKLLLAVVAGLAMPVAALAQPIEMSYEVTDLGGGQYEYYFKLELTNGDGSWAPGQGWGWIVFGDQQSAASPLTDFVGDFSYMPIPVQYLGSFDWTSYSSTGGGHNGPTLGPVSVEVSPGMFDQIKWVPEEIGDFIEWGGTSTADLQQGEMLWSSLVTVGSPVRGDFTVAERIDGAEPCYADCDESGELDFFDFLCFQNEFAGGSAYADCDDSGDLDFFDFLCYQNEFAAGCP